MRLTVEEDVEPLSRWESLQRFGSEFACLDFIKSHSTVEQHVFPEGWYVHTYLWEERSPSKYQKQIDKASQIVMLESNRNYYRYCRNKEELLEKVCYSIACALAYVLRNEGK